GEGRGLPARAPDGRAATVRGVTRSGDLLDGAAPGRFRGGAQVEPAGVRRLPHFRAGGDGGTRPDSGPRRRARGRVRRPVARRRHVAQGAWAAVGASAVTAVVIEVLFQITPGQREVLEGVTMLLATAVLFYVSYWLVSKIEAAKWNAFVKSRMEGALSAGS